jgi:hypothetical protein
MNRITISQNMKYLKYLLIAFIVMGLYQLIFKVRRLEEVIISISIMAVAGLFSRWIYRMPTIAYDDANLYIVKNGAEEAVNLTAITIIEATGTRLNDERFWRITYRDSQKQLKSVKLLTNSAFNGFTLKVEQLNSN